MKRVVVQTTNYVSRTSSRNACIRRPHLVCTLYLFKGYQVMKIQGVIEAMPRFFIYVECQLNKNTMELLIGCKTELINSPIAKCRDIGWQGRKSRQLQVLADQLTLSQPEGADCAPPHTQCLI